ncbi:MAG TPA: adenylate/guanylate cyclase domain-containing protein [Acidimicrobiia bacterium]
MAGIEKIKGGTEISLSLLFADVRGSTKLAEDMPAARFSEALDHFFELAFEAVDAEDGVIDHIVGDGVMALWVPGFVGADHPKRAVAAGRRLRHALAAAPNMTDFPVGIGVHTGIAFAGVVGNPGSHDFTVLGDVPNTTARLGSAAKGGELALSEELARAAGVDTTPLEHRELELKGKESLFPAWIESAPVETSH